ncbi:MAG: ClbS/DfsB family four-helix bundle protein [Pseudomonadota bacterium]
MPAATTKADLIAVCEMDFAKLMDTLKEVSPDLAIRPFEDGVTIKDTVGHRAHWIDLFLGWWADAQAGREVHTPAKGYKWSDLKAYNAKLRADQADLAWSDARALLEDRHAALMALLSTVDDAALYGGPMTGGNGKWTAGRYAEASGASHYRSARKFIRACLRSA